ncbi:hypothetical protein [Alkaliphilus oremlandii]|nr:hypothetical protein [Alkaliphilus oremlandii]
MTAQIPLKAVENACLTIKDTKGRSENERAYTTPRLYATKRYS